MLSMRPILVAALCSLAASQASAYSIRYYSDITSDMSHRLDWRIHESVEQTLRTPNGTAIPQINECYRAGNIEDETRKIYDGHTHTLQRQWMNGITLASSRGRALEYHDSDDQLSESRKIHDSIPREIPNRVDNYYA